MERLTERDEFGNADVIGCPTGLFGLDLEFEPLNAMTVAMNKLAAYEDSGLSVIEVTYLAKALKEGRLHITPPSD